MATSVTRSHISRKELKKIDPLEPIQVQDINNVLLNQKKKLSHKPKEKSLVASHLMLLSPSPGEPEQLIVFKKDPNTGQEDILAIQTGDDDSVDNTDPKIYDAPTFSITEVHTHPQYGPHSLTDLDVFFRFKSIWRSLVVCPYRKNKHVVFDIRKKSPRKFVPNFKKFSKRYYKLVQEYSEKNIDRDVLSRVFKRHELNLIPEDPLYYPYLLALKKLGDEFGYKLKIYPKETDRYFYRHASISKPVKHIQGDKPLE